MMTLTGGWKMTINVAPASVAHALLLTDDRRPFGNFGEELPPGARWFFS